MSGLGQVLTLRWWGRLLGYLTGQQGGSRAIGREGPCEQRRCDCSRAAGRAGGPPAEARMPRLPPLARANAPRTSCPAPRSRALCAPGPRPAPHAVPAGAWRLAAGVSAWRMPFLVYSKPKSVLLLVKPIFPPSLPVLALSLSPGFLLSLLSLLPFSSLPVFPFPLLCMLCTFIYRPNASL